MKPSSNTSHRSNLIKVVITPIPLSLSDETIRHKTDTVTVRRIQTKREGQLVPSKVVVLGFNQDSPPQQNLYIGFLRFNHEPYIPPPLRWDKCQVFRHHQSECRNNIHCSYCTEDHTYSSCPNKDKPPKCINCTGKHLAAYKKCEVAYTKKPSWIKCKINHKSKINPQKMRKLLQVTIKQPKTTHRDLLRIPNC